MQAVLHLAPQAGPLKARLDDAIQLVLTGRQTVDAGAVGDVVVDRLRERVRLLKHHADARPKLDDIEHAVVDVLTVKRDLAGHPADVDRVVHPVQAPQERRLAAPRRPDQGQDLVLDDVAIDPEQGLLFPVEDLDVEGRHLHRCRRRMRLGIGVFGKVNRHRHHRRSNFLRSQIAKPFIRIRNASSTMIAAEVLAVKPRSGLSDQI